MSPRPQPADTRPADDPVGVVLAGGASRRLGRDKAKLIVDGESLALRTAKRLQSVVAEVVIADNGRGLVPGWTSLTDVLCRGPAGGILGAARKNPGRPLLVLACDLPSVPAELLAELTRQPAAAWVVPRWRRGVEPLCALYRAGAVEALRDLVARGSAAPHLLAHIEGLDVRYLEGDALKRFGRPEEMFFNLNSPADLERWES
jgi:molybdopterin-guanine dinucleotide biosynthesis protein A